MLLHGARGVAILFSPSLPVKFLSSHRDDGGHFLLLQASLDRWLFTLLNIYVPTADQPDKQVALLEKLVHALDVRNLFIRGDLNCCLDPEKDRFCRRDDPQLSHQEL